MKKGIFSFILTCLGYAANAQYFNDNLYARYQWNELQEYRRSGIYNVPLKCTPSSQVFEIWSKGENQLANHGAAISQGNLWEDQTRFYTACIREDSSFCDAYFRLAQCLVKQSKWVDVIKILSVAERKFPFEPMVYLGLGQAYLYLQYQTQALLNFEKVMSLLPSSAEGYLGASMVAYQQGQTQKALDYLQIGLKKVNELDIDYLKVFEGILYYHTGQTKRAYSLFLDLKKPSFTSRYMNPFQYATVEKWGLIGPMLEALAQYYIGLCFSARGENYFKNAISHLKIAKDYGIVIDSTVAKKVGMVVDVDNLKEQLLSLFRFNKIPGKKKSNLSADDAFENRKIDDAILLFSQLIKEDSSNVYPYVKLAECYNIKEEQQKALSIYKLAAKKFRKEDQVLQRLVRQFVRVDSLSSALAILQTDLAKHPEKVEAYLQASLIFAIMNKKAEAISLTKKIELYYARKMQSIPSRIASLLGEFFYLKGDYNVAFGYLNYAIRSGSGSDPYLNYYYARCLSAKGRMAEAKKYFYDAMDLGAILNERSMTEFGLVKRTASPYNVR